MVILCMISQIMKHLLIKLRKRNMMQHWQSLVQSELGLESLKFRPWFRKLTCFYKIQPTGLPKYLLQLILTDNVSYILSTPLNIQHYYCRTDTFKNSFFPNVISEWNKLDEKIKGATSFSLFQASLLKLGRPHANIIQLE